MDDKFEDLDEKFEEIDNKLQSIEDLINVRLEICYKKVNDIYSLQNKVNEITKMNNQSIIHQINQYDEEIEDADVNRHNIYNSLETSMSPQSKMDELNKKCFRKHANAKNQDREMFYMSSINKNEFRTKDKDLSETSIEPEPIKLTTNYKDNVADLNSTSTTSTSSNKNKSVKSNSKISKSDNLLFESSKISKSSKSTNSKLNVDTSDKNDSKKSELNNMNEQTNKSSNNSNIFTNLYKNNKKSVLRIVKDNISLENESNLEEFINSLPDNIVDNFFQKNKDGSASSVILEMNSDVVKPCEVETTSPKFVNAMKILNETNLIKNNSHNKLNELNKKTTNVLDSNNYNELTKNRNNDEDNDNDDDNDDNDDDNGYTESSDSSSNNILGNESFVFAEIPKKTEKKNKIVELN